MVARLTALPVITLAVVAQSASGGNRLEVEREPWKTTEHMPISVKPVYGHGLDDKNDKRTVRTTSKPSIRSLHAAHAFGAQQHYQKKQQKVHVTPPSNDERSSAEAPFFDDFWFAYWGSVAVLVCVTWLYMKHAPPPPFDVLSTNLAEETHIFEKRSGVSFKKADSLLEYTFRPPEGQEVDYVDTHHIPENLWSLILIAALGHAKLRNGRTVTPWLMATVATFMGVLQVLALVLMSHDLDPYAAPVTVTPSTPYGSPWTVNTMKVVMSVFMVVALVSEAGQCQRIAEITSSIPVHRMNGCPHWLPLSMAVFQYIVACAVVWAGVAVVLSFQSVPDIIYSSMSIMCISNIDEAGYRCVKAILGLETKWTTEKEEEEDEVSLNYLFACKVFLLFPAFLGLFMFVRAWMTGVMPTARIRHVVTILTHYFAGHSRSSLL